MPRKRKSIEVAEVAESARYVESGEKAFPRELLSLPVEESLRYFRAKVFEHRTFEVALTQAMEAIHCPADSYVLGIYGPTGAGKTTLLEEIQKELIRHFVKELTEQLGRLIYVYFRVPGPDSGHTLWTDVYTEYLTGLADPLLYGKIDFRTKGINMTEDGEVRIVDGMQIQKLRRAVQRGITQRHPKVVEIDEAQHLARIASGGPEKLRNQIDVLKWLADETKTVHLLAGNYELKTLLDAGEQVCRRTHDIHLPPYREFNKEDVEEFETVLNTFSSHLPVIEDVDLVAEWEYMYEGCLGCVGTLKQWLERALYRALNASEVKGGTRCLKKPFIEYLKLCPVPEEKRTEMMEAIIEYDNMQMLAESKYADARGRYSSAPRPPQDDTKEKEKQDPSTGQTGSGKANQQSGRSKRNNGAKPFQPSPERHPIGAAARTA